VILGTKSEKKTDGMLPLPNSAANLHSGVYASPTKLKIIGKLQRARHKGLSIGISGCFTPTYQLLG
jgi:hypothetical protein